MFGSSAYPVDQEKNRTTSSAEDRVGMLRIYHQVKTQE